MTNGKIKTIGKIAALSVLPAGILGTSIWGHEHNKNLANKALEDFKNSQTFAIYLQDAEKHSETLKQEYDEIQLKYDNGVITDASILANKRNEYDEYVAYAASNQYAIDCILKNKESVYYQNYADAKNWADGDAIFIGIVVTGLACLAEAAVIALAQAEKDDQ